MEFSNFIPRSELDSAEQRSILAENRSRGWKAVPEDAPAWVKNKIAEHREAVLTGIETRTPAAQVMDEWHENALKRASEVQL